MNIDEEKHEKKINPFNVQLSLKDKEVISSLTLSKFILNKQQLNKLKVGDKIDHKSRYDRYIAAQIVNKSGTTLKIHYDGGTTKYDEFCDYKQEPHRFAKYKSISKHPLNLIINHLYPQFFITKNHDHNHQSYIYCPNPFYKVSDSKW